MVCSYGYLIKCAMFQSRQLGTKINKRSSYNWKIVTIQREEINLVMYVEIPRNPQTKKFRIPKFRNMML